MIARELIGRSVSVRTVAAQLHVDESTLRYRLARPDDAPDGRRARATVVASWEPVIHGILERFGDRWAETGSVATAGRPHGDSRRGRL